MIAVVVAVLGACPSSGRGAVAGTAGADAGRGDAGEVAYIVELSATAVDAASSSQRAHRSTTQESAQRAPAAVREARPLPGTGASIAGIDAPVIAWLQDDGGAWRVVARTGAEPVDTALGPDAPGVDGTPASATTPDGTSWVMATRAGDDGQRLWLQGFAGDRWQPAVPGPRARRFDHHPALAAADRGVGMWATWIGEDDGSASAALYASRWDGSSWNPPERLPRSPGTPMAPAVATSSSGAPVVAWAAGDGGDAEIWVSARGDDRWSAPRVLSSNQVPDIAPSIAAVGDELVVAWLTYSNDGYRPVAARATALDRWQPPALVSPTPGSRPRVAIVDGSATVFWRHLEPMPAGGTISARRFVADGELGPRIPVAAASGSPFAVATTGGRLALAFTRPDGRLGVVDSGAGGDDPLRALAAASMARFGALAPAPDTNASPVPNSDHITPTVPENYTAFGDSITNGVYYDPDRLDGPGYRDALQMMVRGFFRLGTVFNAGVDGEATEGGVGRIDNAIEAQDPQAILIMEGSNDILAAIDVDTIVFNLRRMVQRSYEESPDIIPFLAQIPPRLDPGPDGFDGPGNGRIDELNAMLPEIGEEEGAVIVDMNTPFDGHRELMSNPLHPSLAGYEVMAQTWYDAIKPAVLERTNRGDLDGSGRTDGLDLVQLALAFGAIDGEDRYDAAADINGDGMVDGFDLDLLVELFGQEIMPDEEGG